MPCETTTKMLKQIKLESGDVIVTHPDTVGHLSGWIDSLYRASKNLPKLGILSALILDNHKKVYFHGGYFLPHSCIPLGYAMGEDYLGQYPGTRRVDMVPFYCALISKDLVEKLGIPETLGMDIFEDANYCLQAMANGFATYATDKLAVVYQGAPKTEEEYRKFVSDFGPKAVAFKDRWGSIIKSSFKYPVLFSAKVNSPSGFSLVARHYIHALHDHGVKVFVEPLDSVKHGIGLTGDETVDALLEGQGDMYMPQIIWGQAPYFIKNSGVYKIGHCEFEATEAPESWVPYCNMMDELWVPTEWDRKKFVKAGVNVPIYVIAQGIDSNYFHPNAAPMRTDATETFKFLVNAAWYPRKNLKNLITAFQAEFKRGEDVCLIVKTLNLGLNKGIKEELKDIINVKDAANVYVREEEIQEYQLPSLYTMADCFVLPTRGEGWGLPLFEALACGIPVITTGYGAPNEVLRDKKGKPLPGVHFLDYTEVMATDPYVYMEGKKWAEPSLPQLMQEMRYQFENRPKEKALALETSKLIREQFDWYEVVKPMKHRIEEIYKKLKDQGK